MASAPQIKISFDEHSNGKFKLIPVSQHSSSTTQYVPDMLRSPGNLTFVFDEPEVLQHLIRALSGRTSSGQAKSTQMMEMIQKMKLEIGDEYLETEAELSVGEREELIAAWTEAIQTMPEKHRVTEVQLQSIAHQMKDEDIQGLVDPIRETLSLKANRKVRCFVVENENNCY